MEKENSGIMVVVEDTRDQTHVLFLLEPQR